MVVMTGLLMVTIRGLQTADKGTKMSVTTDIIIRKNTSVAIMAQRIPLTSKNMKITIARVVVKGTPKGLPDF